jgi:hypothetical protein
MKSIEVSVWTTSFIMGDYDPPSKFQIFSTKASTHIRQPIKSILDAQQINHDDRDKSLKKAPTSATLACTDQQPLNEDARRVY